MQIKTQVLVNEMYSYIDWYKKQEYSIIETRHTENITGQEIRVENVNCTLFLNNIKTLSKILLKYV